MFTNGRSRLDIVAGGFAAAALAALMLASQAGLASAQTVRHFKVLYKFRGGSDGSGPRSELISDPEGNLYGTTDSGGTGEQGTIFMLSPPGLGERKWKKTTLHSFTGDEGAFTTAGLVRDSNGVLYGVNYAGGPTFHGTVFMLRPPKPGQSHWQLTVLHTFDGTDGSAPYASLIAGPDGTLYGAASFGGDQNCIGGCGTVFQVIPPAPDRRRGKFEVIYQFAGGADGSGPNAPLAMSDQGVIYGTTAQGGGSANCGGGCGTVFKLKPPTADHPHWRETVLHRFTGGPDDGSGPYSKPALLSRRVAGVGHPDGFDDPELIVPVYTGGANGQGGFVRVNRDGTTTLVYSFGRAIG